MLKDCIIIGGGVAGLSAAIRLTELDLHPLVLEAGKYPEHRMCGEFFSPETIPLLKKWGITLPSEIVSCTFKHSSSPFSFSLAYPAGGISRYTFDQQLFAHAKLKRAEILTEIKIAAIHPPKNDSLYQVQLADGSFYESKYLLIGTGRLPQLQKQNAINPLYQGFKSHFEGISTNGSLEMYCFPGGYAGISPIGPNLVNVACLLRLDAFSKSIDSMEMLLQQDELKELAHRLSQGQQTFDTWLSGKVPEFGIRSPPAWPNVFWIGDAAGSIPPICGDGLGIALTTGIMAADYMVGEGAVAFRHAWLKRYRRRFFWGKCLHKIALQKQLCSLALGCCRLVPSLPQKLFSLTREEPSF